MNLIWYLTPLFLRSSAGAFLLLMHANLKSAQWFAQVKESIDCVNKFCKTDDLVAKAGDLIEFQRDFYEHWGVYIGCGYIIDVVRLQSGRGVVRKEKLSDVAQDGLFRVNNLVETARERGLTTRRVNDILKAAFKMLDEEIVYDILNYNCEHFATECVYGEAFSVQADRARGNRFFKLLKRFFGSQSL